MIVTPPPGRAKTASMRPAHGERSDHGLDGDLHLDHLSGPGAGERPINSSRSYSSGASSSALPARSSGRKQGGAPVVTLHPRVEVEPRRSAGAGSWGIGRRTETAKASGSATNRTSSVVVRCPSRASRMRQSRGGGRPLPGPIGRAAPLALGEQEFDLFGDDGCRRRRRASAACTDQRHAIRPAGVGGRLGQGTLIGSARRGLAAPGSWGQDPCRPPAGRGVARAVRSEQDGTRGKACIAPDRTHPAAFGAGPESTRRQARRRSSSNRCRPAATGTPRAGCQDRFGAGGRAPVEAGQVVPVAAQVARAEPFQPPPSRPVVGLRRAPLFVASS